MESSRTWVTEYEDDFVVRGQFRKSPKYEELKSMRLGGVFERENDEERDGGKWMGPTAEEKDKERVRAPVWSGLVCFGGELVMQ